MAGIQVHLYELGRKASYIVNNLQQDKLRSLHEDDVAQLHAAMMTVNMHT